MTNCTKVQALSAIWEYIKLNKLQDKTNNMINNDLYLKEVINKSMYVNNKDVWSGKNAYRCYFK